MKKNAFTLIELLAVIVILAIIALIATPIVLNIIEDTKKSAQLRSAEFYLDAVEQAIMRKNMSSVGMFKPNTCTVKEDGNLDCEGYADPIEVEVSGEVPEKGSIITIKDGKIDEITLKYGTDTIIKTDRKLDYEDTNSSVTYKTYANGNEVYFDVTTGKSCTNYHEDNSKIGYNGINPTGNQTSCLKFYAFLDKGVNDKVNLLLDHNTTVSVAWTNSTTTTNENGPIDVINQLYEDTKDWKGTMTPENYTMDQKEQTSGANYTIKYSEAPSGKTEAYKARLITAQEIAKITGADKENTLNWNEESKSNYYFFNSLTISESTNCIDNDKNTICNYGWLYDRTFTSCKLEGCLNNSDVDTLGYWTSSSYSGSYNIAWRVLQRGSIDFYNVHLDYGVRPVITVLKSNL